MPIRDQIITVFEEVAQEQGKDLVSPLPDDLDLTATGLDSHCYAHVVARLEDILGVDPLSEPEAKLPATVGEFVSLYETALD